MAVTTKNRYEQASPAVKIQNLPRVIELLQNHLKNGFNDKFSSALSETEYVSSYVAEEAIEAIDSLPEGEDPANYVYLMRQDLMCRSSFVWDLRKGEIPQTGSSSTVAHHPVLLAPGRNYFLQFVEQGECSAVIGDGKFYSEQKCHEFLMNLVPCIGKEWKLEIRKDARNKHYIGVFMSKVASEVGFSITCLGQGEVQKIPKLLLDLAQGVEIFNVRDLDQNGRVYSGSNASGRPWQYNVNA